MVLWIIALYILIIGSFLVILTKKKEFNTITPVLLLISTLPILSPIIKTIQNGNMSTYDSKLIVFSQQFSGLMDPNTAFFMLTPISVCSIYALYKIFDKDSLKLDETNSLIIFGITFISLVFIGTCNCSYILATAFLIPLILQMFRQKLYLKNIDSNSSTTFSTFSYTFLAIFTLSILLYAILSSNGITFDSIINVLQKAGNEFKKDSYLLIFLSTALPTIFCGKFLTSNNIDKKYHKEYFLIKNILYATFMYIFVRFVGMGAIPQAFERYFSIIIVIGIILFTSFKMLKSFTITNFMFNFDIIGKGLSILGVITATLGYSYNNPTISILGFTSSFLFFINTILSDFMLTFSSTNNNGTAVSKNFSYFLKIALYSYSGVPFTLGFAGWICIFGALILGLLPKLAGLQIFSSITLIALVFILLSVWFNSYKIIKNISNSNNSECLEEKITHKVNVNHIISLFSASQILILGVFLKFTLKFIFCPVSLMTGGTKFLEIFRALENYATYYSVFAMLTIIFTIVYIVIKLLILKLLQKD